ncbi:hypothetical protein JCM10599A_41880 [Paraburkholderia kururiensis]
MCSRLKIWAKLFITVVVPAPLEPVTAMMGCLTDMGLSPDSSVIRFGGWRARAALHNRMCHAAANRAQDRLKP